MKTVCYINEALGFEGLGVRVKAAASKEAGDAQLLTMPFADFKHHEQECERRRRPRSSPVRVSPYADAIDNGSMMCRAYYSVLPPVLPVQLRPLPLLPTTTQFTDVATATPNFPLSRKKKASQNSRRVRSILRELVACLPMESLSVRSEAILSANPSELSNSAVVADTSILNEVPALLPASFSSSDSSRALETEVLIESPKLTAFAPAASNPVMPTAWPRSAPPTRYPLRCNVAVQALELSRKNAVLRRDTERRPRQRNVCTSRTRDTCAPAPTHAGYAGVEWAGGVRALRDAHVCHVLRQLRHLRHLNAAVDRAAAAATHAATIAI